MKKWLFIDRDGTVIVEPHDEQVDSFDKLFFLPGVLSNLGKIARELCYELVMVTNQDGLGTDVFPAERFWPVHNKMLDILGAEGIIFREILIDKSFPADNAPSRKPGTALLTSYMQSDVDISHSYVIGDRISDMQLAKNLGSKSIFIGSASKHVDATFSAKNWEGIYRYLSSEPRYTHVVRKNK